MSELAGGTQPRVLLIDIMGGNDGHRASYKALFARLFGARAGPLNAAALFSARPLLFSMIEEGFGRFVWACLIRSLLGRRTVGLLFRPLPATNGRTLRMRSKRLLLRLLRRLPGARVLILVPFMVDPRMARVAHDWFYDLQNWDLALDPPGPDTPETFSLAEQIGLTGAGRSIVSAIGHQTNDKGFDRFTAIFTDPEIRTRYQFAYGGKVAAPLKSAAKDFASAGGFGLDRFVTDDELLGFYAAADLMWCAYDPAYDQASGILGRAMQRGVPVIVRAGSVVHRLCELEGHPHIALHSEGGKELLGPLPQPLDPAAARQRAIAHGVESIARLERALGVPAIENPFAPKASA